MLVFRRSVSAQGVHKSVFIKAFRSVCFTMTPQGDEIIIHSGVYVGMKGWIDPKGNKTKTKESVIVEVDDGDGGTARKHTKINKSSFLLKKNKKEPVTITAKLLEDQPQVKKNLNTVAKDMARLGIVDGRESAEIFLQLVNRHIDALKKKGPKANYFPVKVDEGMYRAFYDAGPSVTSNARAAQAKRAFEDPNKMSK